MRIAALIPVYSKPKRLVALCERLASDPFPDKGIFVVVDGETTPSIAAALERVRGLPALTVIEGRPHLGKAAALNAAAASVAADRLLFLDNDILVPRGFSLAALAEELDAADLVELPKLGLGHGPIADMMKLDFLASIDAASAMADSIGACPSMNGAAFAIDRSLFMRLGGFRPVVDEDMDLAARAFLAGASFALPRELAVRNEVPSGAAEWAVQRKRWMVNNAVWGGTYLGRCLGSSPEAFIAMARAGSRMALPWLSLALGAGAGACVAAVAGAQAEGHMAAAAAIGAMVAWLASAAYRERQAERYGCGFYLGSYLAYTALYLPVKAAADFAGSLLVAADAVPDLGWKLGPGEGRGARRRGGRGPAQSIS